MMSRKFGFVLGLLLCLGVVFAQTERDVNPASRLSGKLKGFQIPEYYDADAGQKATLRSLLMGRAAQPIRAGEIGITGLRIECYDRDGTTNTTVTASDCIYDVAKKQVTSEGILRMARTDGSMSIQGRGFSWDHANALLVISNRVISDFEGLDVSGFREGSTPAKEQKVTVTSDSFSFDQRANNAQYSGNVNVTEPGSRLNCEKLSLTSTGDTNVFEQISGEGGVRFNVDKPDQKFVASGDQFIYVRAQNELAISGSVTWTTEGQKGSADFVTLRQNGRDLSATGNVKMELRKEDLKEGGLVGIPMAGKDENSSGVLTSQSDNLNSFTNRTSLFGNVLVKDGDATLESDTLNIYFSEQPDEKKKSADTTQSKASSDVNQVEWIEALGKVRITQKDHRIETRRAVYKTKEASAAFEEHARWFSDKLQGESDKLYMWNEPQHAEAVGNVVVIMSVEGRIQPLELFGPQKETNQVSSVTPVVVSPTETTEIKKAEPPQQQELQITSKKMYVTEEVVRFSENVLAKILPVQPPSKPTAQPADITQMETKLLTLNFKGKATVQTATTTAAEPSTLRYLDNIVAVGDVIVEQITQRAEAKTQRMQADQMTVQIDPDTGEMKDVIAERNVILEQEDIRATAKRATFEMATQLLELTGDPVAKMPKGTLYADKMIWDRKTNIFKGTSGYRIVGEKPDDIK